MKPAVVISNLLSPKVLFSSSFHAAGGPPGSLQLSCHMKRGLYPKCLEALSVSKEKLVTMVLSRGTLRKGCGLQKEDSITLMILCSCIINHIFQQGM